MTKFTAALSLLLLSAASGVSAKAALSLSEQARRSSRTNPVLRAKEKKRRAKLSEKVRTLATPRNLQNNYYNNQYGNGNGNNQYGNGNNNQWNNNNAYGNGNGNWNGNNAYANNANGNYNNYNGQQGQQANGWDQYNWNQYMEQEAYGFNMPQFSMKFTQCATVQAYSDYLAEDESTDTVLAAERFALFRLCPTDQCSSNTENGCDNNYGEYVVSMDQYLSAVVEAEEERVAGYCQYCQECATIESAKYFWQEVQSRKEAAVEAAQEGYEQWYETYVSNYENYAQQNQNAQYAQANEQNQQAYDNAYNQYANANQGQQQYNYNPNNDYGGDADQAAVAQRYYAYVRDRAQYANNYYANYGGNNNNGNNQNNYYAMNQPQWDSAQMWEFQQNAQRQYSNQNAWASMGTGSFGSYFGQTVLNGYFDQNGDFIQSWGYFNCKGYFVSLDSEDEESMEWDACLWGEMPDNWDGITQETESCNYDYAGSCYNQYDACMEILQDEDYQAYKNGYQNNYQNNQEEQQQQQQFAMKDFVECTQVDPINGNSVASNQEYYAEQYQAKQEYFNTQFNCYDGDEDCEQKREYAMAQWSYAHKLDLERSYYIGPHCSNTGREISLAVYKDEFCSVLDSESSVEDILGYSVGESMNFVPDDCTKCSHDQWDGDLQWYENEDVEQDEIEPMCSMLFQLSGKCQKHLKMGDFYNYNGYQANQQGEEMNDQWKQMYQSEQQAANEESVCSFIESLRSNTYDENGDIVLQGGQVWKNPSQWNREIEAETKALSMGKKLTLGFLAVATTMMGVWACFLHGTLARKNIPWHTKNRRKGEDATDIARQNSGIVMGRSRSGPGSQPLI